MIWSENGVVSKLVTSSHVDKEYLVRVQHFPAARHRTHAPQACGARPHQAGEGRGRPTAGGGGGGGGGGVAALDLGEVCRVFSDHAGFRLDGGLDDGQVLLPVECSVVQLPCKLQADQVSIAEHAPSSLRRPKMGREFHFACLWAPGTGCT